MAQQIKGICYQAWRPKFYCITSPKTSTCAPQHTCTHIHVYAYMYPPQTNKNIIKSFKGQWHHSYKQVHANCYSTSLHALGKHLGKHLRLINHLLILSPHLGCFPPTNLDSISLTLLSPPHMVLPLVPTWKSPQVWWVESLLREMTPILVYKPVTKTSPGNEIGLGKPGLPTSGNARPSNIIRILLWSNSIDRTSNKGISRQTSPTFWSFTYFRKTMPSHPLWLGKGRHLTHCDKVAVVL